MIDRRLFAIAKKKTLILQVVIRCISLGLSLYIWRTLAFLLSNFVQGRSLNLSLPFALILLALAGKLVLIRLSAFLTDQASADLRVALRTKVMEKAFR